MSSPKSWLIGAHRTRLGSRCGGWTPSKASLRCLLARPARSASPRPGGDPPRWALVDITRDTLPIIDDARARRVISRDLGQEVHGGLWVVAQAVVDGRVDPTSASTWCDAIWRPVSDGHFGTGGFCDPEAAPASAEYLMPAPDPGLSLGTRCAVLNGVVPPEASSFPAGDQHPERHRNGRHPPHTRCACRDHPVPATWRDCPGCSPGVPPASCRAPPKGIARSQGCVCITPV